MYADILRSKRTLGWRTCLIVPELTGEIMAYKRHRVERTELLALRREQFLLEGGSSTPLQGPEAQAASERLESLRSEIRTKLETYNKVFHPKWGPLFRAGFQESRFALQVNRYNQSFVIAPRHHVICDMSKNRMSCYIGTCYIGTCDNIARSKGIHSSQNRALLNSLILSQPTLSEQY